LLYLDNFITPMEGKILFIGDGYPLGKEAGSILYKRVLDTYGISKFCYYGLGYKSNLDWPKEFREMPKRNSSLRVWPNYMIKKYLNIIPFIEELYYFLILPRVIKNIKKFVMNNDVKLIIAVFRADVLAVINIFNEQNRLPVLGYISDTVEAEIGDKPIIYRYKRKEYYKAIKSAKGLYVASEAMENYIKSNFNKETSILRLGYEPNINNKRVFNKINDEINVFFAGSVYAQKEFEIFINALSVFSSDHPEYILNLKIATTHSIKSKPGNINIINLGWMEEKDLIKHMQDAHIGYIPYKFDKKSTMQMTYAFPSKTGFYLSTGLPIFFHGPQYSSMSKFLEKYPCGVHCESMDVENVVVNLEKIIFDAEFYKQCIYNGVEAFNKEFSLTIMSNNFNKLIDNVS
jgi:glycosyltransferase involved in cell wall biosynthesis